MSTTRLRFTLGSLSLGLGLVLPLACSSSDHPPAQPDVDAGDGGPDTSRSEPSIDGGPDAATIPQPYDFTVTCATEPCAKRIAARGGAHACAVLGDGSVRCWGANDSGQLGTGESDAGPIIAFDPSPRQVPGLSGATDVAASGQGTSGTTCVVLGTGEVACFGSNAWGQLGRELEPSKAASPTPVVIEGLRAKAVTLANRFALATGSDDRLWSWGTNDAFQLARLPSEAGIASSLPARADRVAGLVRSAAGTSNNGFVVGEGGELFSWGAGTIEQLGRTISSNLDPVPRPIALEGVSSVATGADHVCALGRGAIHCWGRNGRGQLGTGVQADDVFPARVRLPDNLYAVAIAAGGDNTCIITGEGDVHCWGANGSGHTGVPGAPQQATPSRIAGLADRAVQLAIMDESVCALLRNGSIACWGDNLIGQLGRGTRDPDLHLEPAPVVFK